jgi:uncharacterized repeat protein (TIGR03833 family)
MGPERQATLRSAIKAGITVDVVQKQDQRSGALTRGVVSAILTNSATHPHGIKVRLVDGRVGRVQAIISTGTEQGPES